jgi:hypothetical protein
MSDRAEPATLPAGGRLRADGTSSDRTSSTEAVTGEEAGSGLDRRWIAYVLLVFTGLGVLLAFVPGLISFDTSATLWEGQTGFVRDWYTPLGSALFQAVFDLEFGLGPVFIVQTALVVGGLYLCLRLLLRRVPAAIGAAAICAFPPMYAQLSNLSRDSVYLGLTVLSVGLLCRAMRSAGRARGVAVGLAILAAIGAYLWRQNGIVTIIPLVAALTYVALADPSWRPPLLRRIRRPRGRAGMWVVAGVVGCLVGALLVVATQFVYRMLDVAVTHPERTVYVYDLAGISTQTDRNAFPSELPRRRPRRLGVTPADISLPALERNFDYTNVITLYVPDRDWTRGLNDPRLAEREAGTLRDAWWGAVRDDPGAYLTNRLKLLGAQMGFGRRPTDAFLGMVEPTNFGHPLAFVNGYNAARDYVETFVGPDSTIALDFLWLYLLIATLCLAYLWRRLGRLMMPLVVMLATAWLSMLLIAIVGMASSFRYGIVAVPLALVLLIFTATVAGGRRRWGQALLGGPLT